MLAIQNLVDFGRTPVFINHDELLSLVGHGGEFEELLYDLVVAEASRCGIRPSDIIWDPRPNVGDGGRDIKILTGHNIPNHPFIPQRPSIWSAKSGEDGLKPSKLEDEITAPNHPKIREHLRNGNPYVWCALPAAKHDPKEAMKQKVKAIAAEGPFFDPKQVEFRWESDLCSILNNYPGIIAKHFPKIARRMEGILTLRDWEREDRTGFAVPWVDFSARSQIRDEIRKHLRSRSGPNVLHIAGLSGIGKTRTVLEACRGERDLSTVLYIRRYDEFSAGFLRHLRDNPVRVVVVVDEVQLVEVHPFISRVQDFEQRLRFVTIGPAHRGDRDQGQIRILRVPETESGVLEVIRQIESELPDAVLASIAQFAAHDLRLALLLVEASRQEGEYRELPRPDGERIWKWINALYRKNLSHPEVFEANYRYLTVAVDIGVSEELRPEVEYLSNRLCGNPTQLDKVIPDAVKCGLGLQAATFFEALPRALAIHLFCKHVWPSLAFNIGEFLSNMPTDRLLRRFIERCQECPQGPEREQMEAAITLFFQRALGNPNLGQLVDRPISRLFQTWAELNPALGLGWLRCAIEQATDDDLAAFDGENDFSGGWRGRRQIVSLCVNLASFAEHFWECEHILFRLAQVETEPAILNNSTGVWRSLFLPGLGATEVPFPERADGLLKRLKAATTTTFSLVAGAVTEALTAQLGLPLPPSVVGGRLVPERWRPKSIQELRSERRDLALRTRELICSMQSQLQSIALVWIIDNFSILFSWLSVDELKAVLAPANEDEEMRRLLRRAINSHIDHRFRRQEHSLQNDEVLQQLRAWNRELAPVDLPGRIRELTAKQPWEATAQWQSEQEVTGG
jgi:hypothetical protein